jgi:hypothetical protein
LEAMATDMFKNVMMAASNKKIIVKDCLVYVKPVDTDVGVLTSSINDLPLCPLKSKRIKEFVAIHRHLDIPDYNVAKQLIENGQLDELHPSFKYPAAMPVDCRLSFAFVPEEHDKAIL